MSMPSQTATDQASPRATTAMHALHQVPDPSGPVWRLRRPVRPRDLDGRAQPACPRSTSGRRPIPSSDRELGYHLKDYVGRPSPLYLAGRLTEFAGGAEIYLKREDLNHTGAHKINNAIGQVMLARRMGKKRVIAETGAGQHGVATATACALFGLECTVYMGEEDIRRQKLNVFNMKTMGAQVVPVTTGSKTLRDATNEAMRDWMGSSKETHYTIGSVVGPHPFPDDRARLPVGHRPRGPRAVPRAAGPLARCDRRVRGRRVQRGGDVLSVH